MHSGRDARAMPPRREIVPASAATRDVSENAVLSARPVAAHNAKWAATRDVSENAVLSARPVAAHN